MNLNAKEMMIKQKIESYRVEHQKAIQYAQEIERELLMLRGELRLIQEMITENNGNAEEA